MIVGLVVLMVFPVFLILAEKHPKEEYPTLPPNMRYAMRKRWKE